MSSADVDEKQQWQLEVSPAAEVSHDPEVTKNEVSPRRVLRKLDLRLLPFISFLYFLAFL